MTRILSRLNVDYLDNSNHAALGSPFGFISDNLIRRGIRQIGWRSRPLGHEDEVWFPLRFVFDFESVPELIRGPLGINKRGGTVHDGDCRKDAFEYWPATLTPEELADPRIQAQLALITDPSPEGMTKSIAADDYMEIMSYCDGIDFERFKKENHRFIPKFIIVPVVTFKDWIRNIRRQR